MFGHLNDFLTCGIDGVLGFLVRFGAAVARVDDVLRGQQSAVRVIGHHLTIGLGVFAVAFQFVVVGCEGFGQQTELVGGQRRNVGDAIGAANPIGRHLHALHPFGVGVLKHAKQTFGGFGLLLVGVHHLTIRAHDPLLVVLDGLKLLMHLVIGVVRSGRGGIQLFDADAKSVSRLGRILERAYPLRDTAKKLLDGIAVRKLPTIILVDPILRNGLLGFGNSRGSVRRTALNVLERVGDSPVHRLRVRGGIIVRTDRTARQTQRRGHAANGDANRPAKKINHATQSGLQQTSLTGGTLSRLADTTNQASRTSASGNASDGGTTRLRTIHTIQLRSGLVGCGTHLADI